jgi:hypothetical protein
MNPHPTPADRAEVTRVAVDRLQVALHPDRVAMGTAAANEAAQVLREATAGFADNGKSIGPST